MAVSLARAAAFDILLRTDTSGAYASELLHSSRATKLSPSDHGLATELVLGVLRWRSLLDSRLAEHSSQVLQKMDLEVLTALRLGAYQLLFLDRIPQHAAVNECVELVKQARKRSAAAMVNAILRRVAKGSHDVSHTSQNTRAGLQSPADCAKEFAHPQWLVERWGKSYGLGVTEKICAYDQATPPRTIRANDSEVIAELRGEGIALRPAGFLEKAFIVEQGDITRTRAFCERRVTIQDEASQLVALVVGHGRKILDCCAAPGGKTRILAEQNPRSVVIAMELHPHRAMRMSKLVPNANVKIISADARSIPFEGEFDRVLVDAPCSGTGTLARNPEIKWRLKAEDVARLQKYQAQILLSAMGRVADRGRLIYSTCSLEPEENSEVIAQALAANRSFRVVDCREELLQRKADQSVIGDVESLLSGPYLRTIPGVHRCDGFFAAILERS